MKKKTFTIGFDEDPCQSERRRGQSSEDEMPDDEILNQDFDSLLTPEGLGSLLFSEADINTILSLEYETRSKAIKKAQLLTEARIRQITLRLAAGGSTDAQKQAEQWLRKLKLEEILND